MDLVVVCVYVEMFVLLVEWKIIGKVEVMIVFRIEYVEEEFIVNVEDVVVLIVEIGFLDVGGFVVLVVEKGLDGIGWWFENCECNVGEFEIDIWF